MSELKVGDVVQLKSGGPKMTINTLSEYNGKSYCMCIWFEANNHLSNKEFISQTLKKSEND